MLLVILLYMCVLSASMYEPFTKQVMESVRERKVTHKMMSDRLKCLERREQQMQELNSTMAILPEYFVNELDQLRIDKMTLKYVIDCMKTEE